MIPLVEFAYSQLDWVDNTKIGVMGHSMGGSNTWNTARHYGRLYMQALEEAQAPDSDGGKTITEEEQAYADSVNKVAAAFPTSSVRNTTDEVMAEIHCNFGTNFGFYDEGAYRCVNGDGDLHDAPEALAIVNSILPESEKLTGTIEIAKMYGDPANDTLRVVYNPHEIHPWQHFSTESAGYTVDFFTTAFQMENPIPSSNQYWLWKELFNCIGLVGAALLIVPLATLLLKVPCFASLAGEEPKKLPALTTAKSKAFFWGSWCLSWIISWLSFIPIGKLDQYIFPEVTNRGLSNWVPAAHYEFYSAVGSVQRNCRARPVLAVVQVCGQQERRCSQRNVGHQNQPERFLQNACAGCVRIHRLLFHGDVLTVLLPDGLPHLDAGYPRLYGG